METSYGKTISSLSGKVELLIQAYEKRQKEVNYVLERLKNLKALVEASESDMPKELVRNWIEETILELLKMEDIDLKQ